MIGIDAFCPRSGAPLTDDRHYDADGRGLRAVSDDDAALAAGTAGELTGGAIRSSRPALVAYFRRCHARHEPVDTDLYGTAALLVYRLLHARETQPPDVVVWYALLCRLDALGHDTEWMHAHAALRCPVCHGRLRYERIGDDLTARCAVRCSPEGDAALETLRHDVVSLYDDAFDDAAPLPADSVFHL
ncbi:hypothetical protein [Halomarina oriensis]|uniref:Uncharacterized protein n=1 Tax=Halomarina oriensis TaxID=671145 RepID=A0A6B0GGY6_9EURY|nr:hypothetical protein [Halomarina oriensis]MWG33021.1 hypothetical protein [Halomarina oriensis]